ncbi:acyl-homoserine-lactone synthase [Pseudomonas sp. PCH446]
MHMEEHTLSSMSDSLRLSLGRYRYQQFVEKLGWQLPCPGCPGCEWDAYDHAHARYLLALNPARELIGCARLIPTTAPNLLEGVFSHTCAEGVPASAFIWEMTRFTTSTRSWPCRCSGSAWKLRITPAPNISSDCQQDHGALLQKERRPL